MGSRDVPAAATATHGERALSGHEWVLIGHVHLSDEDMRVVRSGADLDMVNADLCKPDLMCYICEKPFTDVEFLLPCEGPPVSYTRSGSPVYARDN